MTVGAAPAASRAHGLTGHFSGGMEELYIKDTSAENRPAYLFSDDCRVKGTYLIDLTTEAGRSYFAEAIQSILNRANFSNVQLDGMEKLQLISAVDFGHSKLTPNSGLFKGHITPGHYHRHWPLRVGQGITQGLELAQRGLVYPTAIELSFMASGLGPWRPDDNTYVDERVTRDPSVQPNGYVRLGLQWHGKILQRVELSGMAINAYNTVIDAAREGAKVGNTSRDFVSIEEVDYFFGGLVATGVGPQPLSQKHAVDRFDQAIGSWIRLFHNFGHLREEAIQTLHYDAGCCHVQGLCQWVICNDVVAVGLGGGSLGMPVVGLYAGASVPVEIPAWIAGSESNATTLLVFKAAGVPSVSAATGTAGQRALHVAFLSPGNTTLTLSGDFWRLAERETVRLTVRALGGQLLSTADLGHAAGWSGTNTVARATYEFDKRAGPG